MLGAGLPIESFRPVRAAAPEQAVRLALYEFGEKSPGWLIAEVHRNRNAKPMRFGTWIGVFRRAASRIASMLF